MARSYKPKTPFNVPILLLIPTDTVKKGVKVKDFDEENAPQIFGSFRTFGGTEAVSDGVLSVIDTAIIETWYRPDITSACQIKLQLTGEKYEIVGTPENIDMRNQFLVIKVRHIGGNA